jgi:hypothetical protein
MTRITGSNVIQTPCCGAQYRTPAYGSINLSAQEYWTDGRRVGSLFGGDGGLRQCQCGAYYLLHMCDHIRTFREETTKPKAPKGWQGTKDNWWSRLWGKPTLSDYLLNYDIRDDEEIQTSDKHMPPMTQHVDDKDLVNVIQKCRGELDILVVARRRLWQHLNDPFREVYRKYKETNADAFPPFEAKDVQVVNMVVLIELLESLEEPPWLELAELHRETGEMDDAAKALEIAFGTDVILEAIQGELIGLAYSGPVRYRYL